MRFVKVGSQERSLLGNLPDEYHASTRNSGARKRNFTAQEINYRHEIRELVSEAPLHLDHGPRVSLPRRRAPDEMALEQAITSRRSERWFAGSALQAADLASVLYLANGVRGIASTDSDQQIYQRNVPNAGSLGSVELYPIVMNADVIEPGVYHYDSVAHDLATVQLGQFRTWLEELVLFQVELTAAAVALVLTSAVGRLQSKYGPRGYRLGLLDVGHVSQNVQLVATALGLGVCATAGFVDAELDLALGIDGMDVATMLVIAVGPVTRASPITSR